MAELIDVGKHCELDSCKRLDFTPFNCHLCSKSFCQDHRLNHGCTTSRVYEGPSEGTSFDPVRPYLCSYEKCPNAESVKITCRLCLLNYCLKHRHEDEHSCTHIPKNPKEEVERKMAAIREACGVKEEDRAAQVNTKPKKVLKLTEAQKARMDKVSLMKLKLNNKTQLGPNESLIVFVEWSEGREPIMIGKSWTIGRAISSFTEKHTEFSGGMINNWIILKHVAMYYKNTRQSISNGSSSSESYAKAILGLGEKQVLIMILSGFRTS